MIQDWINNKKKRYFLVFYTATNEQGRSVLGHIDFVTGGTYISQKEAVEQIKSYALLEVLITNIIELTEQDIKHFKS